MANKRLELERAEQVVARLLQNLRKTGRFGLDEASMRSQLRTGAVPYLFRARAVSAGLEAELRALIARSDASDQDRLWAFSFLEDDPESVRLLKQSGALYIEFLNHSSTADLPMFVRKMARFQLALIAPRGFCSAIEYVAWVRSVEEDTRDDMRAHVGDGDESPAAFLLNRLQCHELIPVLPISVYRLGQFGGSYAIGALVQARVKYPDRELRALIDEAVGAIRARLRRE